MGRVDNRRLFRAEMSADAPSVSMLTSDRIQILDRRQKVVVEKQKRLCEGINIDNLIDSTRFYIKVSRIHVFCSDFI